ncbi:MAG: glycosyltransferase [Ignavibacteriae bacterium]|nr:glycosyltransferase [Ignavibacteriota bacterium]
MLTPIESLLLIALILYALEFVFLQIGLWKANNAGTVINYEPIVTVIVAARNEEDNIGECVESLFQLNYPNKKLEIIVISDHSSDNTFQIVNQFSKTHPNLICLEAKPERGNLRGKTNAITQAIEVSKGEILMFTDADCTVSPEWIRQTVKYFDDKTGIVGGFTTLKATKAFEGIQALDWLILFSTSSGTAGWKIPLTAIGNNISVRKEAYEQSGGYYSIPFSVTEDYALVRSILSKTKYKLKFPLLSSATISSKACSSVKQLFRQKQRWAIGGLDMIPHGIIIFSLTWTLSFALLVGLFTANSILISQIVLLKLLIDFIYLFNLLKKLNKYSLLKYILFFELYFTLYVVFIPFVALFSKKVIWKERSL